MPPCKNMSKDLRYLLMRSVHDDCAAFVASMALLVNALQQRCIAPQSAIKKPVTLLSKAEFHNTLDIVRMIREQDNFSRRGYGEEWKANNRR